MSAEQAEPETQVIPEFPEKLKQLRQKRGWSQGQLAKKINSDVQRISKYERGVAYPTTEMAAKIAEAFEVTLDYLILNVSAPEPLDDPELIGYFKEITQLPKEDRSVLINLMEAYIKKKKFEALVLSKI